MLLEEVSEARRDIVGLEHERVANGEKALETVGLSYGNLHELIEYQLDSYSDLLLTSSSVQGLATKTSDFDLICIVDEGLDEARGAAQIFKNNRRFETIIYSSAEVNEALANLHSLDSVELPELLGRLYSWDATAVIRLKYLERLVNGVSHRREMPYRRHLPALCRAWSALSFDKARQFALLAELARRAGERRSPAAYAMLAAVHLMDAILSTRGDAYTNMKWYLLRWRRSEARRPQDDADDLPRRIDALWTRAVAALGGGEPLDGHRDLLDSVAELGRRLGFSDSEIGREEVALPPFPRRGAFADDAELAYDPAAMMALAGRLDPEGWRFSFADGAEAMEPAAAAAALHASRARLISFSLAAAGRAR